jgi:AcrR family transcriptional regulator
MAGTSSGPRGSPRRPRLSRERILRAALKLADERGIEALSMRNLGQALKVEAMSLYKHVSSKDDVLDGISELVMEEFEVPSTEGDWQAAIRRSAISAHDALRRHPWAGPVLESRVNPGHVRLRYLDAVVGTLRRAGFSMPDVARAFMAIDSHTYGFTIQELALPFNRETLPDVAVDFTAMMPPEYQNVMAMAELAMQGRDAIPVEFEFGLDLILDGLARRLAGS